MKKILFGSAAGAAALLILVTSVVTGAIAIAATFSLSGDATVVSPGNDGSAHAVRLRADASPGSGGIDFAIPSDTTFADLDELSTDYMFEADDSCGGGSPHFEINVEDPASGDTGSILVYIGPPPSYTGCPPGAWTNSDNLLGSTLAVDTSQLIDGAVDDPYATAFAKYGDYDVTGIQIVVDSAGTFSDREQTVYIDNTIVDTTLYTYDQPIDKEDCQDNNWKKLTDDTGGVFKNQGDCASFAVTGTLDEGTGD